MRHMHGITPYFTDRKDHACSFKSMHIEWNKRKHPNNTDVAMYGTINFTSLADHTHGSHTPLDQLEQLIELSQV